MNPTVTPAKVKDPDHLCTCIFFIHSLGNLFCVTSLILGGILFGISLTTILTHGEVSRTFDATIYYYGVYVLLFASLCTACLALFGLCGMSTGNRFLLLTLLVGAVILVMLVIIAIVFIIFFPYPSEGTIKEVMLRSLNESYGSSAMSTYVWDYMQSYLQCCAVENSGWSAYLNSEWFRNTNDMPYLNAHTISGKQSNPAFIMVPKTCCYRKLDYLTRQLTDEYQNVYQCQFWPYGPPKFTDGPHNDALYYRGCFPTLRAYIRRFSVLIAIFGSGLLVSLVTPLCY
ncbi:unnamed protein product [Schistocephalus solidus]|uniref:Tetraspanin n=1 Tax=Schistocephalus solidus TaxID=70667 RepID=A0A183TEY2_SCHSO|nr:unnamed protein product [Schistocephalus solidus]